MAFYKNIDELKKDWISKIENSIYTNITKENDLNKLKENFIKCKDFDIAESLMIEYNKIIYPMSDIIYEEYIESSTIIKVKMPQKDDPEAEFYIDFTENKIYDDTGWYTSLSWLLGKSSSFRNTNNNIRLFKEYLTNVGSDIIIIEGNI
jgi:hypothetical protein